MTKARAIQKKCLACCGGSHKEVTLCQIFSCQLWPFRFGVSKNTKNYRERMQKAKKRYAKEFKILDEMGVEIGRFFK